MSSLENTIISSAGDNESLHVCNQVFADFAEDVSMGVLVCTGNSYKKIYNLSIIIFYIIYILISI